MKYLLDTNICIYIINARHRQVLDRFQRETIGDIGVSVISAVELAYGVTKSGSARNRGALEKFLAPLEVMPLAADTFWHYGTLRASLEQRGLPIGSLDT